MFWLLSRAITDNCTCHSWNGYRCTMIVTGEWMAVLCSSTPCLVSNFHLTQWNCASQWMWSEVFIYLHIKGANIEDSIAIKAQQWTIILVWSLTNSKLWCTKMFDRVEYQTADTQEIVMITIKKHSTRVSVASSKGNSIFTNNKKYENKVRKQIWRQQAVVRGKNAIPMSHTSQQKRQDKLVFHLSN